MKFINKRKWLILLLTVMVVVGISGCNGENTKKPIVTTTPTTEDSTDETIRYNKTDNVVILAVNVEDMKITAKSTIDDSVYLLNYTGGTNVLNKYGTEMTMAQVSCGEVADVYFVDGTQKLIKLQISAEAWVNDDITGVVVYPGQDMIKYAGEKYKYESGVVVLSNDKVIGIEEVVAEDYVTIRGYGSNIVSVVVEKGHGYLELTDTTDFEGGVVEVGSYITKIVESDMVITVPEGTYNFAVANNGIGGESEITVNNGETIPISLLKYKNKIDKYGLVKIIVNPEEAVLYVDGEETDYSEEVQLQYGTHKILIQATGCSDFELDLTVDNTYTTLTVDMIGENETTTEPTTSGETETESVTDSEHKIYLSTTDGADIYFDGVYKGTAPVSFEKVTGTHIVILMKKGYKTKIYSIDIPDDNQDYIKVFEALEKDE